MVREGVDSPVAVASRRQRGVGSAVDEGLCQTLRAAALLRGRVAGVQPGSDVRQEKELKGESETEE